MKKKIAIAGSGGFAKEVLTVITAINSVEDQYEFVGFIDKSIKMGLINGYPILGDDVTINNSTDEALSIVIAVGEPWLKKRIREKYTNQLIDFPTLIHPSVIIGNKDFVDIGEGCIICAGVIITSNVVIKDFVTINLCCTVGHDTVIERYSSFMPSVNISGEVSVEEGVYVGTGTKIINRLRLGTNSIIGAGAVVAKDLPANCTAVGIPAKPIKFH